MKLNSANETHPISIEFKEDYEGFNLKDYSSDPNPFSSRIPSDKQNEEALRSDYSGRELYEIIQNADDAKASVIEIELDANNHLHIRNDGDCPFTNHGIRSVMRPHQSSKQSSARGGDTIGNKGLGIRSLLNWSNGITIHSNGVKLEFSAYIARRRWQEIISGVPSLKPLEVDGECPLPILAVPIVSSDDVTGRENKRKWTTEIEIICHADVISDVTSKIKGIKAEILLFLRNIRKISFKIHNDERIELVRGTSHLLKESKGMSFEKINLRDEAEIPYLLCRKKVSLPLGNDAHTVAKGEIAVGFSLNSERICEYLFSYFPTKIPLNLPCAIHADFDLTMSRNSLVNNKFNAQLMVELAKTLMVVAQWRAGLITTNHIPPFRLLPLLMLTLGETVTQTMHEFADYINNHFDSCKVIPSIDGDFKSFTEGVYYTADVELSDFTSKISSHSLLNNYISKETNSILKKYNRHPLPLSSLHAELSELAARLSIEENAALIIKLLKVPRWSVKPSIIRLNTDRMADPEEPSYLLASKDASAATINERQAIDVVPPELNLNVIHPMLSRLLQKELNTDPRGLTKELKEIAKVFDADFSTVKQEIESRSEMLSIDELNGVLLWLYIRWKKYNNDNESDAPLCYKFRLLNEAGNHKQLCSLLLHSDQPEFKLNKSHIDLIPEEDRKSFFIDYLGVAEALPVGARYFGQDCNYVTDMLGKEWVQRVQNANPILNVALIPAKGYIRNLSIEEVLTLILSDRRFLQHLYENREIAYSFYGEKSRYAGQSYSAYWLTHDGRILSPVLNYIIPRSTSLNFSILNEGILDINKIQGFSSKAVYDLLALLGAKDNPNDLAFSQLYQLLENQNDASKAQRNYRELRQIIKDKMDTQNQYPNENDRNILRSVWVTRADVETKRIPKEEAYYWDNSRMPRRFLNSLWKLMLPSRTGEKSVSEIFGVKLLSDLNLNILRPDDYNENLSEDMHYYLFNRLRNLIAMSLTAGDYKLDTIKQKNNDIRRFISQLRFAPTVRYQCQGKIMEGVDGDIINDMDHIFVCTSLSTIDEALKSPQVCNNIAKGLCMKLRMGIDNEVRFLHVIQSSPESLEYEWNELDETLRTDIDNVIGLLEVERLFWQILKVNLDDSDMDPVARRKKILSIHPEIDLPDPLAELKDFNSLELYKLLFSLKKDDRDKVSGFISLNRFYKSQLEAEACRLAGRYKTATFKKLELSIKNNHSIENIQSWLKKIALFEEKIESMIAKHSTLEFIELDLLLRRFNEFATREFPLLREFKGEEAPNIKPQYEAILRHYHVDISELTYSEQAIGFFDGFESDFEALAKHKADGIADEEPDPNPLIDASMSVEFTRASGTLEAERGGGNGGFTSSQTKGHIGRNAELRVREYLESNPDLYESVTNVSQRHKMHCDLMYRRKDNPIFRYLEVKSVNGKKIHFTPAEIAHAKANPETYDLALVYKDSIKIIPYAFRPKSELIKNLLPSGYEIDIVIKEEE